MKTALNKQRKTGVTPMKNKAWKMFSLYMRTKGSMDGYNTCYTCENSFPIKKLQAGHGLGGRGNAVLFDERIVKPQCVGCNIFANGRYTVFTRKLIDELGLEKYDEIVAHSNTAVKLTRDAYETLFLHYKDLYEGLE